MTPRNSHRLLSGITLALLASASLRAADPSPAVKVFATPEAAIEALLRASRTHKPGALQPLIGREGEALFHSHDRTADLHGHSRFSSAYAAAHHLDYETADRAVLVVGQEDWPMPVPLVHVEGGWQFDVQAGTQEILNRRIGHNELDVIEVCRSFVLAQHEFASLHRNGAPAEFAQRLRSHANRHDGLYWPSGSGEPKSPLGPLVAAAAVEVGEADDATARPYRGYYFRVLTQQGPHAPGGARSYLVDGHLTGGFALVAYPARYAETGVMTFIVSQSGIVREKNLGPQTATLARSLDAYDPDPSWEATRPVARTASP